MLSAGANQFASFWTRDFAHSVRGLTIIGEHQCVSDHLDLVISLRRSFDGLVPRVVDSVSPRIRVMRSCLSRFLHLDLKSAAPGDALRAEYYDEHQTAAIDSNALIYLSLIEVMRQVSRGEWSRPLKLEAWRQSLGPLFDFYHTQMRGDWIWQSPFADWQDSVRREGVSFYLSFLYAQMLWNHPNEDVKSKAESWQRQTHHAFFDPTQGIYRSLLGRDHISLEGNLFAILSEHWFSAQADRMQLYQRLKQSPLWLGPVGLPGFATWPKYPRSWRSLAVQIAGVDRYHDGLYWSWLMALAAQTAYRMGDVQEGDRILGRVEALVLRDAVVNEVYDFNSDLSVFQTWLYQSEAPFSWGAAKIIEAIYERRQLYESLERV